MVYKFTEESLKLDETLILTRRDADCVFQTPTTTVKSAVGKAGARKSPRSKTTSSQSQRAQEAAKARDRAREEARKRLLAAKKAGRIRKRPNSDKDEIEIFVAE